MMVVANVLARRTKTTFYLTLFILLISVSLWRRERELWMRPRTLDGWKNKELPETVQHQKNLQYLSANVRPFWRWDYRGISRREEKRLKIKHRGPKATAMSNFRLLTALCLLLIIAGDVELNPGPLTSPEIESLVTACKEAMTAKVLLKNLYMLHLFFIGPPLSGKTTLLLHLLERNETHLSTGIRKDMLQCKEMSAITVQVEGSLRRKIDSDDQVVLIAENAMKSVRSSKSHSTKHVPEFVPLDTNHKPSLENQLSSNMTPSGFESPFEIFTKSLQKKRWCKAPHEISESYMVHLVDTSGQPEFAQILPMFASGPNVFFIVFRLDEGLHKKNRVKYVHTSGACYESTFTFEDFLLQSLGSISLSYSGDLKGISNQPKPKIFIIGTHKDKVTNARISEIDSRLQQILKNTELYTEGVIKFASADRLLLAVNSLSPSEGDIQHLWNAIFEHSQTIQEKVSVSWVFFFMALQHLQRSVLTYAECLAIGHHCGIDTNVELDKALHFLHNRGGLIRYFQEVNELQDVVIIKPQVLLDSLTDLMVETFASDKVGRIASEQFSKKGLFEIELYRKNTRKRNELITHSALINLLHHLHIITQWSRDTYSIPCILPLAKLSNQVEAPLAPPLLVYFSCGYVPKGAVFGVVANLLSNQVQSQFKWELSGNTTYRNLVCFSVGREYNVEIQSTLSHFQVEIHAKRLSSHSLQLAHVCNDVRHCIERATKEVLISLRYPHTVIFAFMHACCSSSQPHPATISNLVEGKPRSLECTMTPKTFTPIPDANLVWFQESIGNPKVSTKKHNEERKKKQQESKCKAVKVTGGVTTRESPQLQDLAVIPLPPAQWFDLGLAMKLEVAVLRKIAAEQKNLTKCKRIMFKKWMDSSPDPSWKTLIAALKSIGEVDVAKAVCSEYNIPPSEAFIEPQMVEANRSEADLGVFEMEEQPILEPLEMKSQPLEVEIPSALVDPGKAQILGGVDDDKLSIEKSSEVIVGDEGSSSSASFHSLPSEYDPAFLSPPSGHRISSPQPRDSTPGVITASDSKSHLIEVLQEAVLKNDATLVDTLLKDGRVQVDEQLKNGHSAVMLASIEGHGAVTKILLKYKASVTAQNPDGATPLYLAANYGNYEVCKYLVAAFSDVNAATRNGTPMLLSPAMKGFSMITELLLESGANPNLADKLGNTPLIAAATRDQKDVVKVLLHHGADVTAVSKETSRTALQEAVHCNHGDIVTMLVKAESLAAEKSHQLFTCKTPEEVSRLVKEGSKVDVQRGDKATPLMVHAENGNKEVAKQLINCDANVDAQDEHGHTALMKAAEKGNLDMVQTLLSAQAILDLKSKTKKWTALMFAVSEKHTRVVKELLLAGAETTTQNKDGKTALDMARELNVKEIVDLLQRESAVTSTNDPFIQLLSGYLEKPKAPAVSPLPSKKKKKTSDTAMKPEGLKLSKTGDETSTLKDQLTKAWKRIADLETRIHDLTLQLTMETPAETDLSYFDRGRLEAEFRKLKELKKKSEQYAAEAKQTAQRLSAENFKLKEDLSRERHHNELTRKSMLREMEIKVDKTATQSDRADAKLEVIEQELTQKALQLIRRMPNPARSMQFPQMEIDASQIMNFILHLSIRANTLQIRVTGLPFSGKSTLLCSLLELKSRAEYANFSLGNESGLKVCEAIMLKDTVNAECKWIPSRKEDAEFFPIAAALAQVCVKNQKFSSLVSMSDISAKGFESVFSHPDLDKPFCSILDKLRLLMMSLETMGQLNTLMAGSLTFVNLWDVGMNKAVNEVLPLLSTRQPCQNLLLLDVFSLARDAVPDHFCKPPQLGNEALYGNRYTARSDDNLMNQQNSLNYLVQSATVANGRDRALLVGTGADQLTRGDLKATKARVMRSVQGRAEEVGIAEVICQQMVTVNGQDPRDASKVRAALEEMIKRNNQFEREIKLSWIFLRCILLCTKKLFMTKREVIEFSHRCGLKDEQDLEEWIKLFQSCGNIICLQQKRTCPTPQDYIILNPLMFFQELEKLYYIEQEKGVAAELWGDAKSTREGILTKDLAKHLWDDQRNYSSFFLQVLQSLGVVVKVDEILKEASGSCYFMPSLRSKYWQSPLSTDCSSLLITTSTAVPFHKQTEFVLRLKQDHKDKILFVPQEYCNVLQFDWTDPEVSANIQIRFFNELTEVAITATSSQLPTHSIAKAKLFSAFKSTFIDVFQEAMQDVQYNLSVACPNATTHGFHAINFHPLQQDTHLFCFVCQAMVEITGDRALWIMAAYQGWTNQILEFEGSISTDQLADISDRLSHLPFEDKLQFAMSLGFTESEVFAKCHSWSAEDLLLRILLDWKRRNVGNERYFLAGALLKIGHFQAAIKMDPACIEYVTTFPDMPLTDKEIAVTSSNITDWMAVGYRLRILEADVSEIRKKYRNDAERCFQMLKNWNDMNTYGNGREVLAGVLNALDYSRLAEFLKTGSSELLIK